MKKLSLLAFCIACISVLSYSQEILRWEDCLRETADKNPQLKYSEYSLIQAQTDKKITGSSLLPQISASASQSVSDSQGSSTQKSKSLGVSGSMKLFDSLKTPYEIKAASKKIDAQYFAHEIVSSDILQSLRVSFVSLMQAQEMVKLAESILARKSENLELVKLRYQGGREHKGALLTAEADLSEAEYNLQEAQRGLSLAGRSLAVIMGGGNKSDFSVTGEFQLISEYKDIPDFDGLAGEIPFIKQLEALREESRYNRNAVTANIFPSINATASYRNAGSEWDELRESYNAGVSASMPIFTGGANAYRIRKSHISYLQSEFREINAKNEILYSLEQSWKRLIDAKETLDVRKKHLEAYEERAKIASSQYSMGLMGFDNWIIIENNLVSAQRAYIAAQANLLSNEANWIHTLGGTINEEIY